jgi:hypothetical protein
MCAKKHETEIEIIPEMIEAGYEEYRAKVSRCLVGDEAREVLRAVYAATALAAPGRSA